MPGILYRGVIEKLAMRIDSALVHVERDAALIADVGVRMDAIAIAVALEYTDFRYQADWRRTCPGLADWLEVLPGVRA